MLKNLSLSVKNVFIKTRAVLAVAFSERADLFYIAFALYSFLALIEFFQPYVFSKIFALVSSGGSVDASLWQAASVWVGALLFSFIVRSIVQSWGIRYNISFNNYSAKSLLSRMYQKLLYFDITLHENESSGKHLSKLRRAIDRIQGGIDIMLYQFIPSIVQIIFVLGVVFYFSSFIGLAFFSGFLILLAYILYTTVYLFRIFDEAFKKEGIIGAYFVETLSQIRTIRFFGQEHHYRSEGEENFSEFVKMWSVHFPRLTWYLAFKFSGIYLQVGLFAVLSVHLYLSGAISLEHFVFLITLSPLYMHALESFSHNLHKFADFYASIADYYGTLELEEKVTNRGTLRPLSGEVRGEISFDDVVFRYEGTEYDQFDHFSVTFAPQKTTAIVGASGAGKSTLVKLLFRLYDVQSGSVRLDGIDIREFDQREYRRLLAIVPQDVELFNASIRENILMGDEFSDEEVWAALKLAVLDDRIRQMPERLDTEVGERGVKLSGGERQRLGIARALIRRPKILVLDEATSSLDTLSERQVKEAIYNLEHLNITVIVIAHRLSTIQDADEILVFEAGKIVERGTHQTLLAKHGTYSALQGEQIVNV